LAREAEGVVRGQAERILQGMDLVKREEFDAVKAMAEKARLENERLAGLVAALEGRLAALESRTP
jgi:BMFP domain-containing protein YqiC